MSKGDRMKHHGPQFPRASLAAIRVNAGIRQYVNTLHASVEKGLSLARDTVTIADDLVGLVERIHGDPAFGQLAAAIREELTPESLVQQKALHTTIRAGAEDATAGLASNRAAWQKLMG